LPKPIKHLLMLCVSVLLAIPVVGFVGGMILCKDCGSNPFAYLFMGAIHAILTTFAFGHLWTTHDERTNAWPYIVPTGILIYLCFLVFFHLRQRGVDTMKP
jgi:hypothetical protein